MTGVQTCALPIYLEKSAGDNRTAVEIAGMKIASDHATRLMDGMSLSGGGKE